MQNWVKQLFSSTDKLFDILNVGRLIFYTTAGFLAIYPLVMTGHLLVTLNRLPFFESLKLAATSIGSPWWLFFASVVLGFVIAKVGFTVVVSPVFAEAKVGLKEFKPSNYSFNYRYPQLKNDDDEDYQAWLLAEYFRYVEIATFVPMGAALGVAFLGVYTLTYLLTIGVLQATMTAIYPALVFLLAIAILLGALCFYVWPKFWRPKILVPTMRTYIKAKISLIEGLEDHKRNQAEGGQAAEFTKLTEESGHV